MHSTVLPTIVQASLPQSRSAVSHRRKPGYWAVQLTLWTLACAAAGAWAAEPAQSAGWTLTDKRLGLAWMRYREPVMRLQGPALTLRLDAQSTGLRHVPDVVSGELLLARLDYRSTDTGNLSGVPAVGWRAHALWQMPELSGKAWRLGLQYEGFWNDLTGNSSTGHRGYERLSNKLWLLAEAAPLPQSELQLGLLLRGWQDSWLSQADSRLADVTNIQKRGLTLRYRHSPWPLQHTALAPWVRYTEIGQSDFVGVQRWYEPRNRTLEVGLEARF